MPRGRTPAAGALCFTQGATHRPRALLFSLSGDHEPAPGPWGSFQALLLLTRRFRGGGGRASQERGWAPGSRQGARCLLIQRRC